MSSVCPAGHSSSADDYCDVCVLPIGEQPAAAAPADPVVEEVAQQPAADPAADASTTCPNCQAVNPANALFCEACGYDFTTGSLPRPPMPALPDAGVEAPLVAEDVADLIAYALNAPAHVNLDLVVVRPVAQAAAHLLARGPLRPRGED